VEPGPVRHAVKPTPAEPLAWEALAALHARAFDRPWRAQDIAAVLREPGGAALQAGSPPSGFILLRLIVGEAEILTLAVEPMRRRAGLGLTLVEAALKHTETCGADTIWLEVAEDNAAARALYVHAGFTEIGRRRGYYQRPDGAVDALVMQRRLNSP
jgi:ribosomal-protein-alanine N-acetyltransferase